MNGRMRLRANVEVVYTPEVELPFEGGPAHGTYHWVQIGPEGPLEQVGIATPVQMPLGGTGVLRSVYQFDGRAYCFIGHVA